jgi:hypothetical protein
MTDASRQRKRWLELEEWNKASSIIAVLKTISYSYSRLLSPLLF